MMMTRMPAQAEYRRSRQPLLTHVAPMCATAWAAALRMRIGVVPGGEWLSVDGANLAQGGIRLVAGAALSGNVLYAFGSDDPIGKLNRCWSSGRWQHQGRKQT
jgi:hypothetical protein